MDTRERLLIDYRADQQWHDIAYVARVVGAMDQAMQDRHMDRALCILCRLPAAGIILYVPAAKDCYRVGTPANKIRIVPYFLCKECFDLRGVLDRAEQEIFKLYRPLQ
jgi:hypothetical protein